MKIKLKIGGFLNILGEEESESELLELFARVVDLPEEDICFSEYDSHSGKITVTYGVGKPWDQKKIISKKPPKDFVDFYKPYFDASYKRKVKAVKGYLSPKMQEERNWRRVYEAVQYCEAQPRYVRGDMEKLIECVMEQTDFTRIEVKKYISMPGSYQY